MKAVLAILSVIVLAGLVFCYYFGFFSKVEVSEKEVGPFKLAYRDVAGSYGQAGRIGMEVYKSLLADEKIQTERGFGIYYDNPRTVKEKDLRSAVGCIIEEKNYGKLGQLQGRYKIMEYPKTMSVYAEFPLKGPASFIVGVLKVYPEISKYIEGNNYEGAPALEIYDMKGKKIEYSMPIKAKIK